MKKEDMQQYAASSLDLPAELATGVPRIVVTGNHSVLVENHGGIRGFCPDQIKIGCLYGEILVEGKDLRLRLLKKDEIEAEGEIFGISFQKEEHR